MEIELCIPDPNPYIANGLPKQTPIFRDHPEAKHLLIVHGRQNLATLSIESASDHFCTVIIPHIVDSINKDIQSARPKPKYESKSYFRVGH